MGYFSSTKFTNPSSRKFSEENNGDKNIFENVSCRCDMTSAQGNIQP